MFEELKKILLAGLGSATYTYEKATKFINDMVEKGKLTMEEGKELTNDLKNSIKEKTKDIKSLNKNDIMIILKDYISKDEFKDIEERLSKIENKLKDL